MYPRANELKQHNITSLNYSLSILFYDKSPPKDPSMFQISLLPPLLYVLVIIFYYILEDGMHQQNLASLVGFSLGGFCSQLLL